MPKTRDFSLTNQHSKLCINRNNQIINFSPNLVWTPQLLQLVSMYAFFSLSTRHTIWKMAYHGTTRRFEKNMPILFLTLSKNMHQVFRDTHKIESWKNYHENVSKHHLHKCIKLIFNPSKRPGFYHCKRWTVFVLRKKASNSFSQGLQNIVRLDQKSLTK